MHAGHILLGKAWELNRKAKKNRFTNRYSFVINNKLVTLVPLTQEQIYEDQLNTKEEKDKRESEEFVDVFREEIPPGLPPIGGVEHQIDFFRASCDGKKKFQLVQQLHEHVKQQIEKKNEQYAFNANKGRRQVLLEPRDWVWVHMRKERFRSQIKSKLPPRGEGPFQVLEDIN
ncbi:Transposon Ty3-G Gag-Pol polyprotein [Senna tora]|uniref:Transposon Ty3-G Gag-Pol polyprotein n=1 Tax=Senna tora TaxID=362788 RepID=A0A834WFN4_9FABA|nr:Transposon Ty3-G Gag-Pol polyprotein [Senna tora]